MINGTIDSVINIYAHRLFKNRYRGDLYWRYMDLLAFVCVCVCVKPLRPHTPFMRTVDIEHDAESN